MQGETRQTGVDVIGAVPWSTHICQFYQTKQDLIDILVPYFRAGLENNESCIWVTAGFLSEKEAEEALRKAVPDFDQYLGKRQMEIPSYARWYLKGGVMDRERVLSAWIDRLDKALAKGYDGIRVSGDMAWLEERDWANFTDYEEEINNVIGKYPILAICSYPLDKCGAGEVIDVMGKHQLALIKQADDWVLRSRRDKRAEERVRKEQEFTLSLLHGLKDGFAVVDAEGRQIQVNDELCRMTGYSEEELLGQIPPFTYWAEEGLEETEDAFKKTLNGIEAEYELIFKRKNGERFTALVSPRTTTTPDGDTVFFATIQDITVLKQAEKETASQATSRKRLTRLQRKLAESGLESLGDQEIIELLLSQSLPGRDYKKLAKECIEQFKTLREFLAAPAQELEQLGLTPECISFTKLVHDIPVKVLKEKIINRPVYHSSEEFFDYLNYSMRDLDKEVFKVIYLNNRNQILEATDLFEGTLDSIPIRPRDIVEGAIENKATGLIFAHNHPAGDPTPSRSDKQLTRDMVFTGMILQIRVVDHLVTGSDEYFSFADTGLIQKYEDDFLNLKIRTRHDVTAIHLKNS